MLLQLLPFILVVLTIRAENVRYCGNKLVSESIALFDNRRFTMDVIGQGNDSLVYMTINEPIDEDDNVRMLVDVERQDGTKFSIPESINICTLLQMENDGRTGGLKAFKLSKIFNMEGKMCPIQPGKTRFMPYMFPPTVSVDQDFGYGNFLYQTTLEECKDKERNYCMPLITVESTVALLNDCSM